MNEKWENMVDFADELLKHAETHRHDNGFCGKDGRFLSSYLNELRIQTF